MCFIYLIDYYNHLEYLYLTLLNYTIFKNEKNYANLNNLPYKIKNY